MIAYELLGERSSYELLILSKSFEFWSQNYVKIILFFWFKISATIDFIIYLQFSGRVRLANQLYSNEVMKFKKQRLFYSVVLFSLSRWWKSSYPIETIHKLWPIPGKKIGLGRSMWTSIQLSSYGQLHAFSLAKYLIFTLSSYFYMVKYSLFKWSSPDAMTSGMHWAKNQIKMAVSREE